IRVQVRRGSSSRRIGHLDQDEFARRLTGKLLFDYLPPVGGAAGRPLEGGRCLAKKSASPGTQWCDEGKAIEQSSAQERHGHCNRLGFLAELRLAARHDTNLSARWPT